LKIFEPPTLSVAMLVEYEVEIVPSGTKAVASRIVNNTQQAQNTHRTLRSGTKAIESLSNHKRAAKRCRKKQVAVLKLFDWRHAKGLRSSLGRDPWTPYQQDLYTEFVLGGNAQKLLSTMKATGLFEEGTPSDLENLEWELYMWYICNGFFDNEVATYKHLSLQQGIQIPKFYHVVGTPLDKYSQSGSNKMLRIPGILLEYISGFTLAELPYKAPRDHWATIIKDAVEVVHMLSDNDVRNEDIRLPNFVIRPGVDPMEGHMKYKVFMIDFGHCQIREENESDEDWGFAKWNIDEEGALILAVKAKLIKHGYELELTESGRWNEFEEPEHKRETDLDRQ
jgi:hypothetical protein